MHEIWSILDDPPGHLALEGTDMMTTRTLLGTSVVSSSEERFTPAWQLGPFSRQCGGETWVTDSVTSTLVVDRGLPVVGPTAAWDGVVEVIDERLTVTAGTFDAVRSKTTLTAGAEAGSWTRVWNSIEHGVMLRQETYDRLGRLVGSFEAIRVD